MGLFKTTLMGTGAALVSVAAAQAADLPVRKAAPVEYVRVCDAYGAGFFFIPGTNTCLRISGRVRADYAIVGTGDIYSALGTQNVQNSVTRQSVGANGLVVEDANTVFLTNGGGAPTQIFNSATGALVGLSGGTALGVGTVVNTGTTVFVRNPGRAGNGDPVVAIPGDSENLTGWEARGRMGFDARTATTWGTVQAVAQLRMARQTGILQVTGVGEAGSTAAGVTLEAAYVRFAGFTFGAARDNFANMPSVMYMAAGHWASFANGAKQLAYTHTFGGGFSATLAIQDYLDTAAGARAVGAENSVYIGGANCLGAECYGNILPGNLFASTFDRTIRYRYDTAQLNGRLDWQQGWGALGLAAAVANPSFNNVSDTYDERKTVWAVGGTLTFNLPMLASGSRIDLTAAYADGMTEYTTNWNSFKSSDSARNVNGFVLLPTSVVLGPDGPETVKSWSVGALFQHFWTPEWRMALAASYGQVEGTRSSKACLWNGGSCFGDATVSYVAGQLAWLPTRDFEIGVELAYARVSQDVRGYTGNFGVGTANISPVYATNSVVRASDDNWTGRLRVERNF